jgi:hypothetical protein
MLTRKGIEMAKTTASEPLFDATKDFKSRIIKHPERISTRAGKVPYLPLCPRNALGPVKIGPQLNDN